MERKCPECGSKLIRMKELDNPDYRFPKEVLESIGSYIGFNHLDKYANEEDEKNIASNFRIEKWLKRSRNYRGIKPHNPYF